MKRWWKVASSEETRNFYDDLMEGRRSRGSFGKDTRFNADYVGGRAVVQRFFVEAIRPHLRPSDRVLDFGCGTGVFLALAAPLCRTIMGVDISSRFVDACREMIVRRGLDNAEARTVEPGELPFADETFDVVMMVDVIHHLERPGRVLESVVRRLRPGGRLLIFEPNKLNPLIWLYHALDRNEWGLLRLGTSGAYRRMLSPLADLQSISYNGIVIGPKSKVFPWISNLINHVSLYRYLGWLNPKLFIVGQKRPGQPPKVEPSWFLEDEQEGTSRSADGPRQRPDPLVPSRSDRPPLRADPPHFRLGVVGAPAMTTRAQ